MTAESTPSNFRLSYVEDGEPKLMLTGNRRSTHTDPFAFGLHHRAASNLQVEQETADGWVPVEPGEDSDETVWRHADIEAWLKGRRDAIPGHGDRWHALDDALNDLRDHFHTGTPLTEGVKRVSAEYVAALRAYADGLEAVGCTGLSAQWCPNHGTCACPDREEAMDDPKCPLHSRTSSHAEETR